MNTRRSGGIEGGAEGAPLRGAFSLDIDRCTGCYACAVACMDQNDLDTVGCATAWRTVFTVESGAYPEASLRYVSLACMHCEDAPCVLACPTTALQRSGEPPVVRVDGGLCIGCHGCAMACPYGVPRFGADGRMQKCDLCAERVTAGLEPACVRVCPTRALRYGDPNELGLAVEREAARRLAGG
jgi:anaerobic dimethyl sulfoxide reductase subunit B (iron-sulfur subunit)